MLSIGFYRTLNGDRALKNEKRTELMARIHFQVFGLLIKPYLKSE